MKRVFCPFCKSAKQESEYFIDLSKGTICKTCQNVMFPTNAEHQPKLVSVREVANPPSLTKPPYPSGEEDFYGAYGHPIGQSTTSESGFGAGIPGHRHKLPQ